MKEIIFDIETDGLLDKLTKVHVMSWTEDFGKTVKHTFSYNKMVEVITSADVLIGHNIVRFDIKALKKVLGVNNFPRIIDSLPMSWVFNHKRVKHGLESYGEDFGIPKPVIEDWDNLTPEEYAHRCDEDVKINSRMYKEVYNRALRIYGSREKLDTFLDYLTFKMECAANQEEYGWRLDVSHAESLEAELAALIREKTEALAEAMPQRPITKVVNKPKVYYKKDGTLSAAAERWENLRKENYQPESVTSFTVVTGYERGNPSSPIQVKDWLFSLGWKPRTWKYVRDKKTGEERKIEQVRNGEALCDSVLDLVSVDESVTILDGLTVLQHRHGIVKGFLQSHKDGWLKAEIAGLTNTLRFKHSKPLVNLPGVDKPWGEEVRGCLIAPSEDHLLCGSDMSSLEDTTKRHYMKPLDPAYVEEMSVEGYDPHLSLAVSVGDVSQDEYEFYKWYESEYG